MNEEQEITQNVGRIAQHMMEKIFEPVLGRARKRKLEDEATLGFVLAVSGGDHDPEKSRERLGGQTFESNILAGQQRREGQRRVLGQRNRPGDGGRVDDLRRCRSARPQGQAVELIVRSDVEPQW